MRDYDESTYGERIAASYDELYGELFDTEGAVELLAQLAGDGPVLELGVGTGRLAIPLAERGIRVHAIDSSPAMVERLRAKPSGADIGVTFGDFGEVAVAGEFAVIFVAFNTLFALPTQAQQLACFRNVAERLSPSGSFVVEAFVPDQTRFDQHQRVSVDRVTTDEVHLETTRHDPVAQTFHAHHVVISEAGIKLYPVVGRYVWPSELDLMARLAGLDRHERWGGWRREPFTSASTGHVSVYARPAD